MKLLQLLQNLLIFSILGTQCLALRFSHVPITVDSDVILINKPAELSCNYVKFRTETVREINWFITYQGFSAKVCMKPDALGTIGEFRPEKSDDSEILQEFYCCL